MKIDDIITLDDNLDYLVLDIVTLNQEKYLYCVEVDKEELPNANYKYLKEVEENNETYVEEVDDVNIKKTLTSMLTYNYLINNEEQAG